MAEKRPTKEDGNTPGKPKNKLSCQEKSSRKTLFPDTNTVEEKKRTSVTWTEKEEIALVQYICLYSPEAYTDMWPKTKDKTFWQNCADAVNHLCKSKRSGESCRSRVIKSISKKFEKLSDAEAALGICYIENNSSTGQVPPSTPFQKNLTVDQLSPAFSVSPSVQHPCIGDTVKNIVQAFKTSPSIIMKEQLLSHIFKLFVVEIYGVEFYKFVQRDFLDISLNAMKTLFDSGKKNLIHNLAECFSKDTENFTRMPLDKMPFGLIDYNIRFFACKRTQKLGVEEHYAKWCETMFSHFGHKWGALHRGPAWEYELHESNDDMKEISDDLAADVLVSPSIVESRIVEGVSEMARDSFDEGKNALGSESYQENISHGVGENDLLEEALALSGLTLSDSIEDSNSGIADEGDEVPIITSHIWSHVTATEFGNCSARDMEEHHGITPNQKQRKNQNPGIYDPLKSKTNIASLSVRQLQNRITKTGFTRTVDVQIEALKKAKDSNPSGRWWIKADACDVLKGLRESMKGEWSGDEDLGTKELQKLYKEYEVRRALVKETHVNGIVARMDKLKNQLAEDIIFLEEGCKCAGDLYERTRNAARSSEAALMELSWDHVGYCELTKDAKNILSQLEIATSDNSYKILSSLKLELLKFLQGLYSKKRCAASHLLIFMISDEKRNRKPYAVPVRFLSYKSITDSKLRDLEREVEDEMKKLGMVVVGFSTDGEFNSLRTMGPSRPISVIEVAKIAKSQARSTKANVIKGYLSLDRNGNPLNHHPAIPPGDVRFFVDYMNGNGQPIPLARALLILRRSLFPFNYDPHKWVDGRDETTSEILKSIMAIYLYRYEVERLKTLPDDPADFSKFLYQPERDPDTSELVHHREDHNHLLKRITSCLREDLIPGISLQHLRNALHDPSTGLTYEALTGKNKQSVPDCERIFSPGVIQYLEEKGHHNSARVIKLIHYWHKAADGRGLTEEQRSTFNKDMKGWILDDWIPWHKYDKDFSKIDVNRPIKGICGLTREVIVGLVANLESRELRRLEYIDRGIPPEHPRSSSTDDVEGFIALLHDMLGPVFTLKQFHSELPKILNEFCKRIDPELPFYYWTGARVRYRDFEMPDFNQPSGSVERLDRVQYSRRGDPGVFVANRASLPQRGALTVRAQFHRAPVALPPTV